MVKPGASTLGAALLLAALAWCGPAHPQPGGARGGPLAILWFQYDQGATIPVNSQDYEPDFDAYDCQAADDFAVPPGETWQVRMLRIRGTYYDGAGPADSHAVVFHRNAGGRPGDIIKTYAQVVGFEELPGTGWMMFTLPEPMKLGPGHYWLAVQANMAFQRAGQWAWETRAVQRGRPAVWMNPGDGFETGCTSFQPLQSCFQFGQGPDFVFTLLGTRRAKP